ncbi:MAG TPA: glucose-6-phosphate isomerase [Xanthomonadales bacterium]|nr:glucose-6-phosphate isomerase [Xanthomonadales bacterium]
MTDLDSRWNALAGHATRLAPLRIATLLAQPGRLDEFALRAGTLRLDLSRQRLDRAAFAALLDLARTAGLQPAIAAMYAGEAVNTTERRPALHVALRAPLPAADARGIAADAARTAHAALARMDAIVAALRAPDSDITDVVHVGIGGSDLGPRLACDALAACADERLRVHFVANVDGEAVARVVRALDPRRTVVCLVSKSFGTQETLLNGAVLREWLASAVDARELPQRLVAITANVAAAAALGVPEDRVLPMWDWVGGRFSLWSAVGLPVALACGMDVFRRLLAGAQRMDRHYAEAPLERNLPVWLALAGIWNRNALGLPVLATIPYDERLRLLPAWLQQLEMESNGKRVAADGRALARPAAPVIWGDVGTNAQHAFFQSLHQGVDTVPVDLVGVVRPAHRHDANHRALLANLLAQAAAFTHGTPEGTPPEKACPGDRPASLLLLDDLEPESLGMLLAAYEHKVHAQGVLWGVDSFDQWGVELGKQIAKGILPALEGGALPADADASTRAALSEIKRGRS